MSIAEAMALATVAKMKSAFGKDWIDRSRGRLRKNKSLLTNSKSTKNLTTVVKSEKELEAIAYHLQGDETLETEEACASRLTQHHLTQRLITQRHLTQSTAPPQRPLPHALSTESTHLTPHALGMPHSRGQVRDPRGPSPPPPHHRRPRRVLEDDH